MTLSPGDLRSLEDNKRESGRDHFKDVFLEENISGETGCCATGVDKK